MEEIFSWEEKTSSVKEQISVNKETVILLFCCIGLGIAGDILLFEKPFGISYPIFILVFYAIFLWRLRGLLKFKLDFGWLLCVPVIGLSSTYAIYSNNVFRVLNFAAVPILIVAQTIILTGCNKNKWSSLSFILDILEGMFIKVFRHMGKPFVIISKIPLFNTHKNKNIVKILAGLVISLPVILIVIPLLASADKVFQHYLNNLPNLFTGLRIDEIISRIIFIALLSLASFSYIWSLHNKKSKEQIENCDKNKDQWKILDPVIVSTILVCVNLIYAVFVTIQFTYLLGGTKPLGFSFSEYARRGFFELVAVSLINFSILLLNINFTRNSGKNSHLTVKVLNTFLIICTLIMLYSAHYRMWLYEDAYGYTYLRVFTHSFMVFIFILLIVSAIKVWNTKLLLFKYYVIIGLISYMAINFINVDNIIASKNIDRLKDGKALDVAYFNNLSYDAVKYLEKYIYDKDYSVKIQQVFWNKKNALERKTGWQSFNVSEYNASNILAKYKLNINQP
ncbi:DUF4153 domain-containing protein [Pseudobacteroides cellulosolvens]|uniref:Uncharacterized protein n=1 Tax=Pseudobacteroides cellulosolvens ATCC 35603 = DSM 2933 TaxID=398512 RepID=A0A0L6JU50_9FIRM|nr:DUF4173 domain-containing protein [Pseudobacteroides cellulosolvens]KNY29343.1 protein of unknown function DUF4173 [Pseudobacteroides cellulosolvens ATCC 35603 = DSM 2933]